MKTILLLIFGLLFSSLPSISAEELVPRGTINFTNVDVLQVLQLYKDVTGLNLVSDSRVRTVRHQITLQAKAIAKEEMAKLLEKALLEQAAIVITPLDGKRASVTYNDALPITKANNAPKGN
jgi:type II secretory pathway component GspD/PulD (secretin)